MRSSGILLHISSLPGNYGIGDFGKGAYNFVDFLVRSKQRNWQILPLGVTGYGDSPYQCFSAYAGNPYFIDLDELIDKGYIDKEQVCNFNLGDYKDYIDYEKLYVNKLKILRIAYNNSKNELKKELELFLNEENWLRDFSLFMSIKKYHNNKSWLEWEDAYKDINSDEVLLFEVRNQDEIYFWVFTQYFFFKQWRKLKEYANSNGVKIIGDLPIYISEDSSDIWSNPRIFKLSNELTPITVAGVPPDYFSETGQLWGNPIYDWDLLEEQGYSWWIERIKFSFRLYDILRIDHFRGFESYWEIPYGAENAINGRWVKGPGMKLFNRIKEELGVLPIIAEDLGFLTDDVLKLIKETGFPGMKVLQFAFSSNENNDYLPHNHIQNSVVYTGTHDNNTIMGWLEDLSKEDYEYAVKYLKLNNLEGYNWGVIRGAWSSTANLAIAPMQDFLGLGKEARMNTPSTLGNNWRWRLKKSQLTDDLARKIREITDVYRR